jgi:hypothetical protein
MHTTSYGLEAGPHKSILVLSFTVLSGCVGSLNRCSCAGGGKMCQLLYLGHPASLYLEQTLHVHVHMMHHMLEFAVIASRDASVGLLTVAATAHVYIDWRTALVGRSDRGSLPIWSMLEEMCLL